MDLEQFEEKAKGLGVLGVKVTQHGREIAYKNWDEECRRNIYSASKSVTSCAVGFAIQEGLLSLSERLVDAFHGDLPEHIDGNLEQATVRDLLTMCLGQDAGHLMGAQRPLYKEKDWVKLALSLPFAYKPGTKFVYNNVGPYLAGILVQRRSGCDLVSYLTPRLFDHLGITRPTWEADPLGHTFGAGGLFFTLSELSERLVDAFHGDLPEHIDGNLEQATVRDLLTMCLGQDAGHLMGAQRPLYKEKDWVKLALSLPFAYKPGTKFVYNNVGPYLAGILVQRRSGCDLVSYLTPRLFDHLGITRPTWEADPLGHTFGAGGLFFTLSELHTFGRFYLERGKWNGRQLLAPEWVDESTKKQVDNGALGYGYLFWGGEQGTFRADGKYGQLSILCRDKDAVITVVAECRDVPSLNRAIFDQIYPQL